MSRSLQLKRLVWMGVLLATAFLCLGYRLVDLQVWRHRELAGLAQQNTDRLFVREPRRGDIRDVRGNQLATSVFVKTISADPTLIAPYHREVARVVAPLLEMNERALADQLAPRMITDEYGVVKPDKHVELKRKVTVEQWERIREAMRGLNPGLDETRLTRAERTALQQLRTSAIFAEAVDDQLRVYPNRSLAAHVLGFTGSVADAELGARMMSTVGIEGVERTLNQMLTGVRGWRETETDRRAREIVPNRSLDVEPRAGHNLFLTIDAGVQHIVEEELAAAVKRHSPISASAIIVRPRTGEIVAMATLPTFDPNNPGAFSADQRRNRVITDQAEPGSTFKIVVVSGALNDGDVTLRDRFDCEHGRFAFAGKILHDHEAYDVLSVEEIITKSSNIGSAKIGIKMGPEDLYNYIRNFGFGAQTRILLPGEVGGIVHPLKRWTKLSISRLPMGHEMTATPLQMVMAMSAIANRGVLMRPMLVDRVEDEHGRQLAKYPPVPVRRVVTEQAARDMTAALKTVIAQGGTAVKAQLEHYTVAGKTGTAQKSINGQYVKGKYFSSFIGFFPADNPELCISVVLDEPKSGGYYGGQTAAPVFHGIATRAASYLKITPDILPEEPKPGLLRSEAPTRSLAATGRN
jgi:cell division protein FtsI/penicillin-binding protein 2